MKDENTRPVGHIDNGAQVLQTPLKLISQFRIVCFCLIMMFCVVDMGMTSSTLDFDSGTVCLASSFLIPPHTTFKPPNSIR